MILLWGIAGVLPARVREYREDRPSLKYHPERRLAERGVDRALVLVPESWGSRVIVGLWAMGLNPGVVERAYRVLDTCDLHRLTVRARRADFSDREVREELARMMDASPHPAPTLRDWPDPTVRLRQRDVMPPECERELRRDLEGFHLYGVYAWRHAVTLDNGIVFARDLFERNDDLLDRYDGWPVWRFAPPPSDPATPPVLTQVRTGRTGS